MFKLKKCIKPAKKMITYTNNKSRESYQRKIKHDQLYKQRNKSIKPGKNMIIFTTTKQQHQTSENLISFTATKQEHQTRKRETFHRTRRIKQKHTLIVSNGQELSNFSLLRLESRRKS